MTTFAHLTLVTTWPFHPGLQSPPQPSPPPPPLLPPIPVVKYLLRVLAYLSQAEDKVRLVAGLRSPFDWRHATSSRLQETCSPHDGVPSFHLFSLSLSWARYSNQLSMQPRSTDKAQSISLINVTANCRFFLLQSFTCSSKHNVARRRNDSVVRLA